MSITSDSPSESDGLSATLNNGTASVGALLTVSVVASVVFTDKLLEIVGGAVVKGVGGTTDIVLVTFADVVVGRADVLLGVAVDSVMGEALDSVIGGAVDSLMGGALDSVMGGAADSAVGVAVAELVAIEETSDLMVDVVGNESAIRVGGAADTVVEDKVAVDEITLVVGGVVVVGIKVGRAADTVVEERVAVDKIILVVGGAVVVAIKLGGAADTGVEERVAVDKITLVVGGAVVVAIKLGGAADTGVEDKITLVGGAVVVAIKVGGATLEVTVTTDAATENVTEGPTVVVLITGAVVESTGVDKVGNVEDTVDLALSDKMGVAVTESLPVGDSVKVSS